MSYEQWACMVALAFVAMALVYQNNKLTERNLDLWLDNDRLKKENESLRKYMDDTESAIESAQKGDEA